MAGRIAWLSSRLMIRPTLSVGSYLPSAPWPWGVVEFAARAIKLEPRTVRADIALAHCTAQLVCAAGVVPADGTRRSCCTCTAGRSSPVAPTHTADW